MLADGLFNSDLNFFMFADLQGRSFLIWSFSFNSLISWRIYLNRLLLTYSWLVHLSLTHLMLLLLSSEPHFPGHLNEEIDIFVVDFFTNEQVVIYGFQ